MFGAIAANVMSAGARGLGYFLYGLLMFIFRRDLKLFLAYVVAPIALVVALLMWMF